MNKEISFKHLITQINNQNLILRRFFALITRRYKQINNILGYLVNKGLIFLFLFFLMYTKKEKIEIKFSRYAKIKI